MVTNFWDLTGKKAVISCHLTNMVIKQNKMLATRKTHKALSGIREIDFNGEMVEMGKGPLRI